MHGPVFHLLTHPSTGESKYGFRETHSSCPGFLSRACLERLSGTWAWRALLGCTWTVLLFDPGPWSPGGLNRVGGPGLRWPERQKAWQWQGEWERQWSLGQGQGHNCWVPQGEKMRKQAPGFSVQAQGRTPSPRQVSFSFPELEVGQAGNTSSTGSRINTLQLQR